MEFVLFYEGLERELQNAYLLRAELRKRGHRLYICEPYHMINKTKERFDFLPDAIITPYLYEDYQIKLFRELFKYKIKRIVNLQYEQILSSNKKQLKTQIPNGLCKNAMHLCCGKKWQKILVKSGIKKENTQIVGSINIDMDRDRFLSLYKTKEEISNEYGLDKEKKWILFVSSFGMTNLKEDRKEFYYERHGKNEIDIRIKIEENTRKTLFRWIIRYIGKHSCEFIYRPHPTEAFDNDIIDIEKKYNNFHIIKHDSIRSWINVCDKIHTWYSTTIVDIFFMKKTCSIIRPIDLPEFMHNDILNTGNFTRDYESFCRFNNEDITEFPMDEQIILDYFDVDEEKYAYEKICDLLEDIVKRDVHMEFYEEE